MVQLELFQSRTDETSSEEIFYNKGFINGYKMALTIVKETENKNFPDLISELEDNFTELFRG